jgi:hypothetical protein
VLRIMGENSLLSPHRRPPRPANDHDGSITTEAPNVMWGADGAVIPTVKDGNVTLFIVAEHWNAEGLGWHIAKQGTRYAAAVRAYFQRYNQHWLLEKNGYRSPAEPGGPGWPQQSQPTRPHNAALCPKNRVQYSP